VVRPSTPHTPLHTSHKQKSTNAPSCFEPSDPPCPDERLRPSPGPVSSPRPPVEGRTPLLLPLSDRTDPAMSRRSTPPPSSLGGYRQKFCPSSPSPT
jgi:hypothetical protein